MPTPWRNSFPLYLTNVLAQDTKEHQYVKLTIVLSDPRRELTPCHVVTPGSVGSFFTICIHMMRGATSSLFCGNLIPLASAVHLIQPLCAIGPRGVVHPDIPCFDDGQESQGREEVFFVSGRVILRGVPITVLFAYGNSFAGLL